MKLIYYRQSNNFGDALNPLIFHKFLPEFFDEDTSAAFIGIGSIIHFKVPEAKNNIIFSSGFAYGKAPHIDERYDVVCVRGPLTCERLGLNKNLAITDGAALLKTFRWKACIKKFRVSFMPHHESLNFYDWKTVCNEIGFHFISPLDDMHKVLAEIRESEVIITEAMHGAIVADTLRIPWIPVKFYPTISEFKWHDWTSSLNMLYQPNLLKPIYNNKTIREKVNLKFNNKAPESVVKFTTGIYEKMQDVFICKSSLKELARLQFARTYLSEESILDGKVEQLEKKLELLKLKYSGIYKN